LCNKAEDTANANAFLITLRPNQDIGSALRSFARNHQIGAARIEGIGSLGGTALNDAKAVES
jgi:predicted DNA-binding protein with PD1-like motif